MSAPAWAQQVAAAILDECDRRGIPVADLIREAGLPSRFADYLENEPDLVTFEVIGRSCELLDLDPHDVIEAAFAEVRATSEVAS